MKLIVHADDFGISEKVNEGILQAYLYGILTSTSIMANGRAFDDAVSIARSNPNLDVGIHLTLSEESPLLAREDIATLVGANGTFHGHAIEFSKRYLLGKIKLEHVRKELKAQVKRILKAGICASHLDSHQHLHMLPGVLDIVVELSKEYCIPGIRLPWESGLVANIRRIPLDRIVQGLALNLFCRIGSGKIERKADVFAGFLHSGKLNRNNLLTVLTNLGPNGTCEIMCHPGVEDRNSCYKHWGYHWSDELSALMDEEVWDVLQQKGVELISYRHLANL